MRTYSSYLADIPRLINNSLPDNLTWATEMVNDANRYLITKYYFNERSYSPTGGTVAQQQFYNLPPQVKKLINLTVTIGGVVWQPRECPSREYWDYLNVITFYQDFPSYFFVFNGQVGIYPIPASSGNTITMNYKTRIVDLAMADVSTGTITATSGTITVSNSTAVFANWMEDNWLRIPYSSTNANNGDNQWYQINSVDSTTSLRLKNNYTGDTVSSATYTIGQVSILPEDYQDLPLYRMASLYYTTRFPDATRAKEYQKLWDDGIKALDDEFGSKTTSVILPDTDAGMVNPNLFVRSTSQTNP